MASLEEYFTMVSAGLAASTPHMISASITAVTRILFEFHSRVSNETIQNLLEIMDMFLQNPNREIVRSVLGFVKVEVISLPNSLVKPRLNTLLANLLVWSHEHKAHFKAKVKHIVERMIRKFGIDEVERACPAEDRKLITNIRKTREHRKKKKQQGAEDGEEPAEKPKGRFESEYDQAVYGSESEDEEGDSEDEFIKAQSKQRQGKSKHGETYIVEDEDEPLDLLSKRALGNISSTKPLRRKEVPQKKTKARMNEDGKLILNESDTNDAPSAGKKGGKQHAADNQGVVHMDIDEDGLSLEAGINAYVDAIKGRDAVQRGQKGKLKFSNKKSMNEDDMDVDSGDEKEDRRAKSGSGMGRGRGGAHNQRRGLGIDKSKGTQGSGRVDKGNRSPKMKGWGGQGRKSGGWTKK
ncbi:pre-rRNA processing protein [Paraconiothyrium brasiliense]|uniref:Pre-rRNA processing protein n=1 Tax=Paraconiothyrium brasiliense TaxID=300254 RepID=A0ABR3RLS7_9PLEO